MNYIALLRGINVGGNNVIKKDELRRCFEQAGFTNVRTYIQSGNILFTSSERSVAQISASIVDTLQKKLGKQIPVIIFPEAAYREIVASAPPGWGQDAETKYNALFIVDGSKAEDLAKALSSDETEAEHFTAGVTTVFWQCPKSDYAKSFYAQKLAKHPIYKRVTIRNSRTTLKLLEMFDETAQ